MAGPEKSVRGKQICLDLACHSRARIEQSWERMFMWPLDDITVYFEGASPSDVFDDSEANYIADFYHRSVLPYKPPHTARITIMLGTDAKFKSPHRPTFVGSICQIRRFINLPKYHSLPKEDRYAYALDLVHDSCLECARQLGWDQVVFENARSIVVENRYRFRKLYAVKLNRIHTHSGQIILEKTETTSKLLCRVTHLPTDHVQTVDLLQRKNLRWYDPMYKFAATARWFGNDKFGVLVVLSEDIPDFAVDWRGGERKKVGWSISKGSIVSD